MARADVLQLVSDLSNGQADAVPVADYYGRVIYDLGRHPWLTNATIVATTSGTQTYTVPTQAIKLLGVIYDDHILDYMDLVDLEAMNSQWRSVHEAQPYAYTVYGRQATKQLWLYPVPDESSVASGLPGTIGDSLGVDFPRYSLVMLHTETRQDLPPWLELPVAFEILAREFERESNHRDTTFARLCRIMSQLLLKAVS